MNELVEVVSHQETRMNELASAMDSLRDLLGDIVLQQTRQFQFQEIEIFQVHIELNGASHAATFETN